MSKNIVLCSDGTGNSALKGRGTNVFKIYEAIDLNGHKFKKTLQKQVAFYDDGVGTESFKFFKVLGGAFGWGLSRNVRELYTELARCYKPGDDIFLLGFSRGAFTVRQLAGLIIGCGIIADIHWNTDAELKKLVRKAFRKYRKRYRTWLGKQVNKLFSSDKEAREEFRLNHAFKHKTYAPEGKARIKFIGVWDTVAAVGLPFDHLANFINNVFYRFKFPDSQLSSRVDKACHALSIDDERHSFHPELWDEEKEKKVGNGENEEQNERIEQVWFPGVHSNVGGGYQKQGMSLVALDWMMNKAGEYGLRFIKSVRNKYHKQHNVNDKLYDSRSGAGFYYRYKVRDIGQICSENHTSADIHVSCFHRIEQGTEGYAPVNIPVGLNIVTTVNKPPAAGEDPKSVKKLTDKISNAISESMMFLIQAKKWTLIRRLAHYAFLIITIALVWFANKTASAVETNATFLNDFLKILSSIVGDTIVDSFIKPIFMRPEMGLSLIGLIIIFYITGLLAKSKIDKVFSLFWRRTLK